MVKQKYYKYEATLQEYKTIIKPSLRKLIKEEQKLMDKIWYTRHLCYREKPEWEKLSKHKRHQILKSARKVEKEYGKEWLLDYEGDFEWGMVNGKLEMIRWVLFGHHDDLAT